MKELMESIIELETKYYNIETHVSYGSQPKVLFAFKCAKEFSMQYYVKLLHRSTEFTHIIIKEMNDGGCAKVVKLYKDSDRKIKVKEIA
jgi:hypothetical protein